MQVACGLTNKPKETIVDIDAADAGNDLAAVEYVEDMYLFFKLIEVCPFLRFLCIDLYERLMFANCSAKPKFITIWIPKLRSMRK